MGLKAGFWGAGTVLLLIRLPVTHQGSVYGDVSGCTIRICTYIILQTKSLKMLDNLKYRVTVLIWDPLITTETEHLLNFIGLLYFHSMHLSKKISTNHREILIFKVKERL